GRVLERAELEAIATVAANHNLTIVADEIHADLVYPGATPIPMETIAAAAERTVTLTSATKGFNIAGLRASIAHFGSAGLKEKFESVIPERLLGGARPLRELDPRPSTRRARPHRGRGHHRGLVRGGGVARHRDGVPGPQSAASRRVG